MTIWYVDIMWAFMLFGITVFCGALVVVNRAMRNMRGVCLATCYAVGVWMAITLTWKVALVTWCVFAAFGGVVVFAYELWARYRYASTGRAPRPLILLQGFVLWRPTSARRRRAPSAAASRRWARGSPAR